MKLKSLLAAAVIFAAVNTAAYAQTLPSDKATADEAFRLYGEAVELVTRVVFVTYAVDACPGFAATAKLRLETEQFKLLVEQYAKILHESAQDEMTRMRSNTMGLIINQFNDPKFCANMAAWYGPNAPLTPGLNAIEF